MLFFVFFLLIIVLLLLLTNKVEYTMNVAKTFHARFRVI